MAAPVMSSAPGATLLLRRLRGLLQQQATAGGACRRLHVVTGARGRLQVVTGASLSCVREAEVELLRHPGGLSHGPAGLAHTWLAAPLRDTWYGTPGRYTWYGAPGRYTWYGVPVRALWTSGVTFKAVDTSQPSKSVTSWNVVKKKKNMREAGQDLLEDFKEKKAKVREKMDKIIERENIWTVPNLLCVGRIALSPLLVHLVISANYSWALGLFMFAGVTDLLDGWIARTFPGQASNLGSFLDPLADKVLVALLFLSLTYVGAIPLPLTGLIIYRDVLIIGGASYVRYKSLPPPRTLTRYFDATHATARLAPTTLSKFNTAVQLGLITASLAAPVFCFSDHYLLKYVWWLTAATTLSSGISYIFSRDTYKILGNMSETSEK
nr:cardiolipin synthase (CMP-forming)-like [Procambarus clarkii]